MPVDPADLAERLSGNAISAPPLMGEPGSVLFHYSRRASVLEYILRDMTLRMGPFEGLNDPREAKNWQIVPHSAAGAAFPASLGDDVTEGLQRHTKILCMTQDEDPLATAPPLCRGWAHPRMWAQYAENHEGCCLVFDRAALVARLETYAAHGQTLSGRVTYSNQRPLGAASPFFLDLDAAPNHDLPGLMHHQVQTRGRGLFFTKLADWADEHEYRWIIRGTNEEPIYVNIRDCLAGVILGWRAPDAYLPSFRALCGSDVAILRIDWEEGHPVLEHVP